MKPKETVSTFLQLLNEENFEEARKLLHDKILFEGVLGKRQGADNYINDMKKLKFKYDLTESLEEGNKVAMIYNIKMGGPQILTFGWYTLQNDLIRKIKVMFDPRPVLK